MHKLGFIVGRFQSPYLHEGHLSLIRNGLSLCDEIVIVLGVSNEKDDRNPYGVAHRYNLIINQLKDSINRILITTLKDYPTNEEWSDRLDFLIKHFAQNDFILLGSRDSFIQNYTGKHKDKYVEIKEIEGVSATKIRNSEL